MQRRSGLYLNGQAESRPHKGWLFVLPGDIMPDVTLSPDGTHLISVTPDVQPTQTPQVSQQETDLLRQQLGLGPTATNPQVPASNTPPAQGTQPMSIEELMSKGLLDPNGQHNVTKLASHSKAVSALQRQEAEARREAQMYKLQLEQVQAQAQYQQQLQQAAPHERIQLERDFNQQVINQQQQALQAIQQEQRDVQELEGWKQSWVNDEQVPVPIIQQLELIADQNGIRNPAQRYEFLNRATRRYILDRSLGRVGGPVSGQPAQQPQQPQRPGTPYTPVVAPSNSGVGVMGIRQNLNEALTSSHAPQAQQDDAWRKLYASVGITNI
jgi:hypothetical protein